MARRINDGTKTGLKQDKYRHSRFEFGPDSYSYAYQGVSRKTPNTLGGPFQENRGHRVADESKFSQWENSPFEDGKLYNWNQRRGWDSHFNHQDDYHSNRNHGGALIGSDATHRGKGPKGYKRPDSSIFDDVCEILYSSPRVDASEIEVRVEEGIVFLEGTVEDRRTKKMAEIEVENVSGVKDVQNKLTFETQNNKKSKDFH